MKDSVSWQLPEEVPVDPQESWRVSEGKASDGSHQTLWEEEWLEAGAVGGGGAYRQKKRGIHWLIKLTGEGRIRVEGKVGNGWEGMIFWLTKLTGEGWIRVEGKVGNGWEGMIFWLTKLTGGGRIRVEGKVQWVRRYDLLTHQTRWGWPHRWRGRRVHWCRWRYWHWHGTGTWGLVPDRQSPVTCWERRGWPGATSLNLGITTSEKMTLKVTEGLKIKCVYTGQPVKRWHSRWRKD